MKLAGGPPARASSPQFAAALDLLVTDDALRRGMGESAPHVDMHYRRDAVLERYRALIEAAFG